MVAHLEMGGGFYPLHICSQCGLCSLWKERRIQHQIQAQYWHCDGDKVLHSFGLFRK